MRATKELPREETFIDCTGVSRRFLIERVHPSEHEFHLRATELIDGNGLSRYIFEVSSFSNQDACGKLHRKISSGLALKYIRSTPAYGVALTHDRMRGRIVAGGFVVDGRFVDHESFEALLNKSQGLQFEFVLSSPTE